MPPRQRDRRNVGFTKKDRRGVLLLSIVERSHRDGFCGRRNSSEKGLRRNDVELRERRSSVRRCPPVVEDLCLGDASELHDAWQSQQGHPERRWRESCCGAVFGGAAAHLRRQERRHLRPRMAIGLLREERSAWDFCLAGSIDRRQGLVVTACEGVCREEEATLGHHSHRRHLRCRRRRWHPGRYHPRYMPVLCEQER